MKAEISKNEIHQQRDVRDGATGDRTRRVLAAVGDYMRKATGGRAGDERDPSSPASRTEAARLQNVEFASPRASRHTGGRP